MTSPSWPVRISRPLPGKRVASINRMSPPTGVQARPVATPGTLVRIATSPSKRGGPSISAQILRHDGDVTCRPLGDVHRGAAQGCADLALELAHAGLAGVVADDRAQGIVADLGLLGGQAVGLELARDQVAPRDLEFFVLDIARKVDDLHAVAQRAGDAVEHVRGGDEHDPRQIERHAEIIVAEGRVLLGVEHFEQRRGRIALDAAAELVDLVEHHHAVAAAGPADALDDVAGQRPDIGAAMAADLGFVMRAAEADPDEFPAGRASDALSERGLADAGRADKAQDRAAAARIELAGSPGIRGCAA